MNILDNSANNKKSSVIIFDIDGTLTPHKGGCGECMFCKGWSVYSQEYKELEETILLQKFMEILLPIN